MHLLASGALLGIGLSVLMACGSSSNASDPASNDATGGASGNAGSSGASGTLGSGGSVGSGGAGGGASGAQGSGGSSQTGGSGNGGASDGGTGEPIDSGTHDAGAPTRSGYVIVASRATADPALFTNSVFAGFADGPDSHSPKGCRRSLVATCQIYVCDYADGGAEVPPAAAPLSGGTVTVGGTTPTFTLDYDASAMRYGAVPAVPTDRLLFTGGETITFAASGADAPAFQDSLVAPAPITVTAPVFSSGALSIDTSKDLVFVWTGTSVGTVSFNIRTATTTVAASFVSCQFDASELSGTIPAALLQNLDKTDATTTATLTTDHSIAKGIVVGDYAIHLAVGSVATQADGKTPYTTSQVTIF